MARQEKTRVRAAWAKGPKPIPPGYDFPPVGWGTGWNYEERVRLWRQRPHREQCNCTETRLTRDPAMPLVAQGNIGSLVGYFEGFRRSRFDLEIRWSDGGGLWPKEEAAWSRGSRYRSILQPRKRGYWLHDQFLGEDSESVRKFISQLAGEALVVAKQSYDQAVARSANVTIQLLQGLGKFEDTQPLLDRLGSLG